MEDWRTNKTKGPKSHCTIDQHSARHCVKHSYPYITLFKYLFGLGRDITALLWGACYLSLEGDINSKPHTWKVGKRCLVWLLKLKPTAWVEHGSLLNGWTVWREVTPVQYGGRSHQYTHDRCKRWTTKAAMTDTTNRGYQVFRRNKQMKHLGTVFEIGKCVVWNFHSKLKRSC